MLHARRTALGVGIIKLKTVIAMVILCLYISNIRLKSNAGEMILALEEMIDANSNYNNNIIKLEKEKQYWKPRWIENIAKLLSN